MSFDFPVPPQPWLPNDFAEYVVKPALQKVGLDSLAARQLVLGTAIQESHLRVIRQTNGGPALGYFQMEPNTHQDTWVNFLAYRATMSGLVKEMLKSGEEKDKLGALENNPLYGAALCRVYYYRFENSDALPQENDIATMADYWKTHYNTGSGKGTPDQFIYNWNSAMAPPLAPNR